MESIIKKAIEGGWSLEQRLTALGFIKPSSEMVLDPLFWQALGRACGWEGDYQNEEKEWLVTRGHIEFSEHILTWQSYALVFHEINLTEGWDKAVAYLEDLIK